MVKIHLAWKYGKPYHIRMTFFQDWKTGYLEEEQICFSWLLFQNIQRAGWWMKFNLISIIFQRKWIRIRTYGKTLMMMNVSREGIIFSLNVNCLCIGMIMQKKSWVSMMLLCTYYHKILIYRYKLFFGAEAFYLRIKH